MQRSRTDVWCHAASIRERSPVQDLHAASTSGATKPLFAVIEPRFAALPPVPLKL